MKLPTELQVEVTAACNLRCPMCLVSHRPPRSRRRASFRLEHFRRLVDDVPGLRRITLQGLGEPLLCPDLFDMIAYATARGIAVGFNSNGTLLTSERAQRLVAAGLSWLCISVDGASPETYRSIRRGSDLEHVGRNVRYLASLCQDGRPRLSIVFVAMRRNIAELPDLVDLACDWGVGRVRVQNLSHSFDDVAADGAYADIARFTNEEALWRTGDDRPWVEQAFERARRRAGELGIDLRLPELDPPAPAGRSPNMPGCDWPWRSAYVNQDGKVQPCCMLMGSTRAEMGDITRKPFEEIWDDGPYTAFREALLSDAPPDVCRGCSMYRGVF